MNIEKIRNTFLPKKVKILLIGESPPKRGGFFYVKSAMTTFTSRPYEQAFNITFSDPQTFLEHFRDSGCFLDDLSHEPVDHLPKTKREEALIKEIPHLANRLKNWEPSVICIILKKIENHVQEAINLSGIKTTVYTLPFPGNGHQGKYIDKMTIIIQDHLV